MDALEVMIPQKCLITKLVTHTETLCTLAGTGASIHNMYMASLLKMRIEEQVTDLQRIPWITEDMSEWSRDFLIAVDSVIDGMHHDVEYARVF
jgi:hypothetical protein